MLRSLLCVSLVLISEGHRRSSKWCNYYATTTAEKERCCWKYGIGCSDNLSYDCSNTHYSYQDTEHAEYCCKEKYIGCENTKYHACLYSTSLTNEQQDYCCKDMGIGCPLNVIGCNLTTRSQWTESDHIFCCGFGIGCPSDCTASTSIWTSEEQDVCCTMVSAVGYFYTETQKEWCCNERNIGCYDKDLYDCYSPSEDWSDQQRQWCCNEKLVCTLQDVCYQQTLDSTEKDFCCKWRNIGCEYDCTGDRQQWGSPQSDWCCQEKNVCGQDYSCTATTQWTADEFSYCCSTTSVGCSNICLTEEHLTDAQRSWCCSVRSPSLMSSEERSWCCAHQGTGCHVVEVALTAEISGSDYQTARDKAIDFVVETRLYLLEVTQAGSVGVDVIITKVKSLDTTDHFIVQREWNYNIPANGNTAKRSTTAQQSSAVGVDYLLVGDPASVNTAAQNVKASIPQSDTFIIIHNEKNIVLVDDSDNTDWIIGMGFAIGIFAVVIVAFALFLWRRKQDKKPSRRERPSNTNNNSGSNNVTSRVARHRSPSPPPPAPLPLQSSNEPDKDDDAVTTV